MGNRSEADRADRLTIAGTIAANAHGRGLRMKPFVSNVESFVLVDASGTSHTCSRTENPELFRLVHGGYGLFGIVTSMQLRLVPRTKVERAVEIRTTDNLMSAFDKRIAGGFQYGDFQFSIERDSDDFLHKGVFSCYRPVSMETLIPTAEKQLSDENWRQLLYLAHTDEKRLSRNSRFTISPPTGRSIGPTLTSGASTPTITTVKSTPGSTMHLIPPLKSSQRSMSHEPY